MLTGRLATDASLVNNLAGSVIGIILQAASSFATGIVIGFMSSAKLSGVNAALLPFIVIAGKY